MKSSQLYTIIRETRLLIQVRLSLHYMQHHFKEVCDQLLLITRLVERKKAGEGVLELDGLPVNLELYLCFHVSVKSNQLYTIIREYASRCNLFWAYASRYNFCPA